MAKLPGTNGNHATIVNAYELESTHATLKAAPDALAEAAQRIAAEREVLIEVKQVGLPEAKARLDRALTGATMEAYGAGVITGKNQTERDLQISAYLDKDKAIQEARESAKQWESQLANAEMRLEMVEADYKAAWARLAAARVDAALQTAYLTFLTVVDDSEPTTVEYGQPF
jgi:hypothetical protein